MFVPLISPILSTAYAEVDGEIITQTLAPMSPTITLLTWILFMPSDSFLKSAWELFALSIDPGEIQYLAKNQDKLREMVSDWGGRRGQDQNCGGDCLSLWPHKTSKVCPRTVWAVIPLDKPRLVTRFGLGKRPEDSERSTACCMNLVGRFTRFSITPPQYAIVRGLDFTPENAASLFPVALKHVPKAPGSSA